MASLLYTDRDGGGDDSSSSSMENGCVESHSEDSINSIESAFQESFASLAQREQEIAPIALTITSNNKRQSWYDDASVSSRGSRTSRSVEGIFQCPDVVIPDVAVDATSLVASVGSGEHENNVDDDEEEDDFQKQVEALKKRESASFRIKAKNIVRQQSVSSAAESIEEISDGSSQSGGETSDDDTSSRSESDSSSEEEKEGSEERSSSLASEEDKEEDGSMKSSSSISEFDTAFEDLAQREKEIAPISLETNKSQSWYDNASLSSRKSSASISHEIAIQGADTHDLDSVDSSVADIATSDIDDEFAHQVEALENVNLSPIADLKKLPSAIVASKSFSENSSVSEKVAAAAAAEFNLRDEQKREDSESTRTNDTEESAAENDKEDSFVELIETLQSKNASLSPIVDVSKLQQRKYSDASSVSEKQMAQVKLFDGTAVENESDDGDVLISNSDAPLGRQMDKEEEDSFEDRMSVNRKKSEAMYLTADVISREKEDQSTENVYNKVDDEPSNTVTSSTRASTSKKVSTSKQSRSKMSDTRTKNETETTSERRVINTNEELWIDNNNSDGPISVGEQQKDDKEFGKRLQFLSEQSANLSISTVVRLSKFDSGPGEDVKLSSVGIPPSAATETKSKTKTQKSLKKAKRKASWEKTQSEEECTSEVVEAGHTVDQTARLDPGRLHKENSIVSGEEQTICDETKADSEGERQRFEEEHVVSKKERLVEEQNRLETERVAAAAAEEEKGLMEEEETLNARAERLLLDANNAAASVVIEDAGSKEGDKIAKEQGRHEGVPATAAVKQHEREQSAIETVLLDEELGDQGKVLQLQENSKITTEKEQRRIVAEKTTDGEAKRLKKESREADKAEQSRQKAEYEAEEQRRLERKHTALEKTCLEQQSQVAAGEEESRTKAEKATVAEDEAKRLKKEARQARKAEQRQLKAEDQRRLEETLAAETDPERSGVPHSSSDPFRETGETDTSVSKKGKEPAPVSEDVSPENAASVESKSMSAEPVKSALEMESEQDKEIRLAMEMAIAAMKNPRLSPDEIHELAHGKNEQARLVEESLKQKEAQLAKEKIEAAERWRARKEGWVAAVKERANRHFYYADVINKDEQMIELRKQFDTLKRTLRAYRAQGNRSKACHASERRLAERQLLKSSAVLQKKQDEFIKTDDNLELYVKAMEGASKKKKKKGTDKELMLEAQLCQKMHHMLVLEQQKAQSKKNAREMKRYLEYCVSWLCEKNTDCEIKLTTLDATQQSMMFLLEDTARHQDELIAKLKASDEFKEVDFTDANVPPVEVPSFCVTGLSIGSRIPVVDPKKADDLDFDFGTDAPWLHVATEKFIEPETQPDDKPSSTSKTKKKKTKKKVANDEIKK